MAISTRLNCGIYWVQGFGWDGYVSKNYPSYQAAKSVARKIEKKVNNLTPDWGFYWELEKQKDGTWNLTGEAYEIK